jgi:hypothetical protein
MNSSTTTETQEIDIRKLLDDYGKAAKDFYTFKANKQSRAIQDRLCAKMTDARKAIVRAFESAQAVQS